MAYVGIILSRSEEIEVRGLPDAPQGKYVTVSAGDFTWTLRMEDARALHEQLGRVIAELDAS